jgi:Tfp pilus assembly protein FimT
MNLLVILGIVAVIAMLVTPIIGSIVRNERN